MVMAGVRPVCELVGVVGLGQAANGAKWRLVPKNGECPARAASKNSELPRNWHMIAIIRYGTLI